MVPPHMKLALGMAPAPRMVLLRREPAPRMVLPRMELELVPHMELVPALVASRMGQLIGRPAKWPRDRESQPAVPNDRLDPELAAACAARGEFARPVQQLDAPQHWE